MDVHGRRIAAGGERGIVRVWDVPPVPVPVPDWFPAFAESVAGIRLADRGNLEIVSDTGYGGVAQRLRERQANGVYERVAGWFLADPAARAAVPHMEARDPPIPKPLANRSAIHFDGVDDFVKVPYDSAFDTLPITLTAWIKAKTGQGSNSVIGVVCRHLEHSGTGFSLYLVNGDARGWYSWDRSNHISDGGWGLTGRFVADDEWHHLAFVADTNGGALYVDGGLGLRRAWTGTPGAAETPAPMLIGLYASHNRYPPLAGQVAEVTFWNRALSQAEVQDLMKTRLTGKEAGLVGYWPFDEGSGTIAHDRTGHGHDGTLENRPAWVRTGVPLAQ